MDVFPLTIFFFSDWWKNLPHDEQMGWRIPIDLMFDIEHLRKTRPVLLVREYLAMHGLNQSIESVNGTWEPGLYHSGTTQSIANKAQHTLFSVPNEDYDPSHLVLVDILPPSANPQSSADNGTSTYGKSINHRAIHC
jgi:hypothetical protein